jgi:hypothetical protein
LFDLDHGWQASGWDKTAIASAEQNMSLKTIRLELARTPEFPEGSSQHVYEFTAPLDAKGHRDPTGWAKTKDACTVQRF